MKNINQLFARVGICLVLIVLVSYSALSADDCFRRKDFKIVKTAFGTPDQGDIAVAFPDGIAIGKSFSITASWAHNRAKYPNARYSVIAGFANQKDEEAESFFAYGVQSFQRIVLQELNTSSSNLKKSILIDSDTSVIKHKYFKIQIQMFAGNDANATAPSFLEVRVYRIPIVADIKGKVFITDFNFDDFSTSHTPLSNAMVYLTEGSTTGDIYRSSTDGCFALSYPNDGKSYKLNITRVEEGVPLAFRNVTNIEPITIDARLIGPLYEKNEKMADKLENLLYPASIFYGFLNLKVPLLQSYSMTNQRALVSNWAKYEGECSDLRNGDSDSARADLAIRSMIYNMFMDSITTNSMKLSGETVKFVTDAVLALLSLEDFKKTADQIGKKAGLGEVGSQISNKLTSVISSFSYMFTEDIITRMKLKGNSKKIGEAVKETLKKVKEGLNSKLKGKSVQEGVWKALKDEAIKNTVVIPGNEALMLAYIAYTQGYVESSVKAATDKVYTGTNKEAAENAIKIFQKNKLLVDSLSAFCAELKLTSNWESTIATIGLATTTMVELWYKSKGKAVPEMLATGVLICNLMKQLSVMTISKAALTMLYSLADQDKVLDHGIRSIYDTYFDENNPNWKRKTWNNFATEPPITMQEYIRAYIDSLNQAVSRASASDSASFVNSLKSLLSAEKRMNDSLNLIADRFLSIDDSAFVASASNQKLFDSFQDIKYHNELDRLDLDLRLMLGSIQFSQPMPTDTLGMLRDSIVASVSTLVGIINQVETIMASQQFPAYFSCTESNSSVQFPKPLEDFTVGVRLKNIGSLDAKNVKVAIYTDSTISLTSARELLFETVGAQQEIVPLWTISATDKYKPYVFYQIEVSADGIEKRVFQYYKSIESSDSVNTSVEENFTNEVDIVGIAPNPTNGTVRVSFSAPEYSAVTIALYDVLGTKLQSLNMVTSNSLANNVMMNLGGSPQGIYFLRVDCAGHSAASKIIKCAD